MQKSIDDYVKVCTTCQKSKHRTGKQYGTYTPLDVPDDRWRDINIDFITGMTPDKKTQHDMIMVVVDRFSKMAHFISCKKTDTLEVIMQLFLREVFLVLLLFPMDIHPSSLSCTNYLISLTGIFLLQ